MQPLGIGQAFLCLYFAEDDAAHISDAMVAEIVCDAAPLFARVDHHRDAETAAQHTVDSCLVLSLAPTEIAQEPAHTVVLFGKNASSGTIPSSTAAL